MTTNPMQWLRWLARGIGLAASGIFLFAAIVSGISKYPMPLPMLVLLVLSVASVLVALRWEKVGGIMTMVASVGLGVFVYANAGHNQLVAASIYTVPFFIAGILFIVCSQRL